MPAVVNNALLFFMTKTNIYRYIANPERRSRVRVFVIAGKQQVPASANRHLLL